MNKFKVGDRVKCTYRTNEFGVGTIMIGNSTSYGVYFPKWGDKGHKLQGLVPNGGWWVDETDLVSVSPIRLENK